MPKYPGRIISATPPTVNTSTASGIWTLEEALQYKQAGTWPTQLTADPNFKQTVLLLHGDGTNGAQNNTFLDSSTNNFTITRNGNTTQGTFSPFSLSNGYWSNYFDGTDDYLSVADNAVLRPGAGAFTLEAWIYRNASGAAHTVYAKGGASTGIVFQVTSGNVLRFTHTTTNIDSTGIVAANAWVHVAVVREGTGTNQTKLYINGVQDGQGTVSTDFTQTEEVRIGTNRGATEDFAGYISNVRFVKGSALYTAGFTPSTVPLTTTSQGASSSEVKLLTCQSNRFVDNSTNAFAITRNGDVRVTPFSPFAPTAEYDPAVNGGSGYFDGTGDYLTAPQSTAFDLSGDFTVECWVNFNSVASTSFVGKWGGSGSYAWVLQYIVGTGLRFYTGVNGALGTPIAGAWTPVANTWYHIAATRSSNSVRLFVDGVQVGNTTTNSDNCTATNQALNIGRNADTNIQLLTGYISNLRILKGTAQYTSNFTPPTTPLTAITNTSLLLNFTNAGIFDNTGKNNLETVGNAQIDTTTKKYGTGSLEFDGTGDYLIARAPTNDFFAFGTGDFTIEFWLYLNSTALQIFYDGRPGSATPTVYYNSNAIRYYANAADRITGATLNTGQWYHIAVSRSGTSTKLFVDGTQSGSTYTDSTNYTTSTPIIGADANSGTFNNNFNGYIDDLRITKGVARYTANFTPPAAAFPNF